jgi:DNA-binding PadR family transcriptional regulator
VTQEMREPTFLVLTALADMPRHGYAVIQEVERLSGGLTKLRTGTLYAALDRLARDGLIRIASEEIVGSRLRRYYELTAGGRTALDAESRRRSALSKEALRRLRVTGSLA